MIKRVRLLGIERFARLTPREKDHLTACLVKTYPTTYSTLHVGMLPFIKLKHCRRALRESIHIWGIYAAKSVLIKISPNYKRWMKYREGRIKE